MYKKGEWQSMAGKEVPYKIYLEESELPTSWYNVRADMKNKPAPLLNPGTGEPNLNGLNFRARANRQKYQLFPVLLFSRFWI